MKFTRSYRLRTVEMKTVIILFLFIKLNIAFDLPKDCKSDLTIDEKHYNVSKTYDVGDAYPTDAHYDALGNLFFVLYGHNFNGYYFDVKVIKPDATEPEDIAGLPEGRSYSIAVDKKASKVYFGTSKGIFVYNNETNDAKLISDPNLKLTNLFVDKDGNKYITNAPQGVEELYLLAGGQKILFKTFESLNEMAVDEKNNFYFIREKKLYVLRSNLSNVNFIGNVSYEGIAQISFYDETVFVASEALSYIHENDSGPLKMVKNVPGKVTSITFDYSGSFVLGTRGKIFKYEPQEECYYLKNI